MAKLTRYLQKIFAENSNQVGVFGTGVNKVTSKNVETLQSADYSSGWSAAVVTSKNYPIWQERDGVDYGLSYQIKYLDQAGIPEWLNTETYYTNCYCRYGNRIYYSLKDNNLNHPPASSAIEGDGWWAIMDKDFLNKQNVTNCLLEVPQRIEYELTDGALTLKQGSVLIIPYGTTDLSSTYPVGSTFINNNLYVVDRKYNNGQFFVWAELLTDLTRASSSSSAVSQRRAVVQITSNALAIGNFANTASVSSDADATQSSVAFYNTTTNLMKTKSSGTISDNTVSLPIMITESDETYNIAKIKQVFNGFGFIGKVAWADKGVKFLIPNGLNADGTLNNSELTLTNITIRDLGTEIGVNNTRYLTINASRQINVASLEILYDCYRNVNYRSSTGVVYSNSIIGMLSTDADYNISRLVVETALNINMISDGRWIGKLATLVYNATFHQNDPAVKYSLANYLPDDGFCYEVLFVAYVNTQGNNNEFSAVRLTSDILDPTLYIPVAFARSRTGDPTIEDLDFTGSAVIPVGTGRYVEQYSPTSWAANGKYSLFAYAYRRLGANI